MFYTRIPVPKNTGYSPENLNRATRFFPLIGWIISGAGALAFWGASMIMPLTASLLLSMAVQVLLTGAFHEDAFADFCDGFGGGYTKKQILTIMKDSRIGTYGTTGLVLMLLTKFTLLSLMDTRALITALLVAHPLSRLMSVFLIFTSKYVSGPDKSKSKPVGRKSSKTTFVIALFFGLLPLALMPVARIGLIFLLLIPLFVWFRFYVHKHIGGYTGDVLGALQQLSEATVYLALLIHFN